MTVVDLHPDDLLDKEALGQLEEGERARLEAHLARCATCRFERQLRADFADEFGSEDPLPAFAGLGTVGSERPSVVRHRSSRAGHRRSWAWLFAAAALLVGSVAAATVVTGRPWSRPIVVPAPTVSLPPPPPKKALAKLPPTPAPVDEPRELSEPPAEPTEAAPSPPASAPQTNRAVAPQAELQPAQLLDLETSARRRGDYALVLELHRHLESRYAGSRETQVSRATVGRLMLDRGSPLAALEDFDAYLRSGSGDLAEEALVGRATALDRLGRSDEATRAWAALLGAFPDTPYAAHARSRLGELIRN